MGLFRHVNEIRGMGSRKPSWKDMHEAHNAAAKWEKEARKGRDKNVKYRGSKEEAQHKSNGFFGWR